MNKKKLGLVLSGGGARGAYQVGVIAATSEILQKASLEFKIDIFSGVSAAHAAHRRPGGRAHRCGIVRQLAIHAMGETGTKFSSPRNGIEIAAPAGFVQSGAVQL